MKWEIWGVKAPVIEDSKASFNYQTCNHQSRMKWEIWGAKAPVIEESKASFNQPSNIRTSNKHQTTWETWGAKTPETRESKRLFRLTYLSMKQLGRPGVLRSQ